MDLRLHSREGTNMQNDTTNHKRLKSCLYLYLIKPLRKFNTLQKQRANKLRLLYFPQKEFSVSVTSCHFLLRDTSIFIRNEKIRECVTVRLTYK